MPHLDRQGGRVGLVVGFDVAGAGDLPQEAFDVLADLSELREIVAIDEYGDVGLDAGDQFVDPHLDGLRETEPGARDIVIEHLGHFADQILPRLLFRPLGDRVEHHPDVGLLDPHHVVRNFRPSRLAEDRADLRELL